MAKTGLVHFYKECLRRAFRGKAAKVETITGLLSLVAVPVGLWLWPNEGGAMNWAPLIFFLSLFLASFLFGFELAPYHMLREVEHDNAKLKDKLDNRERRQGAIARLWQRRADGVDLRNQIVKPGDDKEWIKKYEQWREQVLQTQNWFQQTWRLGFALWIEFDRPRICHRQRVMLTVCIATTCLRSFSACRSFSKLRCSTRTSIKRGTKRTKPLVVFERCAELSKLLNLQEWTTCDDAARYLTQRMKEQVSKADVLRLALLDASNSLFFFRGLPGHCSEPLSMLMMCMSTFLLTVIRWVEEGDDWYDREHNISARRHNHYNEWVSSKDTVIVDGGRKQVLEIKSGAEIEGVWDLTMRGGERDYVDAFTGG